MRVDFYHLQSQNLEEALPKLLEKAYSSGKNCLVKIGTAERVEFINSALWSYDDSSFLPHGSSKDGFAEKQPIWLCSDDSNPNHASFLFLVDGATAEPEQMQNFERIFVMFSEHNARELDAARNFYKTLKTAGYELKYWQQINGSWQEKV